MIILRQKQYGRIGKSASKAIRGIGKLQGSIKKKIDSSNEKNKGGTDSSDPNKELNLKLLTKAKTLGMTAGSVLGQNPESVPKNDLTRSCLDDVDIDDKLKVIKKSVSRGHTGYINVNSSDHTPAEIAHEMGHVIYSRTRHGARNTKNSILLKDKKQEDKLRDMTRGEAIKTSLRNLTDLSTLKNEVAASRIGLKLLKKSGATKSQLKEAKKELRPAFKIHLTTHVGHSLAPISKFKDK